MTLTAKEYDEFQRYLKATEWINNVCSLLPDDQEDPDTFTYVELENIRVRMMVDTGAAANTLDEPTFNLLPSKPLLLPLNKPYFGYGDKSKALETLGFFVTSVSWKGQSGQVAFVVMKGRHQCLIGRKTACSFGMVTLNLNKEEASFNSVDGRSRLSKQELASMFPKLFSGKLGCIKDIEVKLEVDENVRPVKQPLRPIAFHYRDAVERELEKQVAEGILEKVDAKTSPITWISNLVIVPKDRAPQKADGTASKPLDLEQQSQLSVRLTCDARPVNKALRRTRFAMRTIEDLVVMVDGATLFSKLDLNKAFHQMQLAEESRNLTTITTHKGLFRYKRLHMGIASASEIFTEQVREILAHLPGQVNMTDDILVFGKTTEEHHSNLIAVLKRLEEMGFTLNLEKSEFYQEELTFFGLRFTPRGISPTENRVKAIQEAPAPEDAKALRSFLCSITWSSRFMRNICTIAEPLWRLTKTGAVWKWEDEECAAFEAVKRAISTDCVGYFKKDWSTVLTVDASPFGLGAVLQQFNPEDPGQKQVVCCISRMLTEIERRYSQCEKEALGVVWGCERLWTYLLGKRFTIETDKRAVKLIFACTKSRPPARIERLALRLSQFYYEIVHRPGETNIADYYSRHLVKMKRDEFLEEIRQGAETEHYINTIIVSSLPRSVSLNEMKEETVRDEELQILLKFIAMKNEVL